MKSFYEKSKVRVRVCRKEGRSFEVTLGLRQRYVMPPWPFNLFMDGVVGRVVGKNHGCKCMLE